MSEQNNGGHAVAAPGMPGVTAIETSLAPKASVQSAHVTDTAGMDSPHAAAAKWQDAKRSELAAGSSDQRLLRENRQIMEFLSGKADAPDWLAAEQGQAQTEAGKQGQAQTEHPPGYEPAGDAQLSAVRTHAVNLGVPPEMADELTAFAKAAALPEIQAGVLAKRLAHHIQESGSADLTLGPLEQQELIDEAVRSFGGRDKLADVSNRARAYLQSVSPELVKLVDTKLANSSIVLDPRVLLALAQLHDVRNSKVT